MCIRRCRQKRQKQRREQGSRSGRVFSKLKYTKEITKVKENFGSGQFAISALARRREHLKYAGIFFNGRTSYTDATAHPLHGHHRTTYCMTCSVRSPGRCTPQRQARFPDTTAPDRRSRLPLLPSQHLVPPFYSRWAAYPKCEGTCTVSAAS